MNKFIKKNMLFLLLLLIFASSPLTYTSVAKANTISENLETEALQSMNISSSDDTVSPCSDIIKWRYKTVDGKLYRRLFNYTQNEWIGKWEAC